MKDDDIALYRRELHAPFAALQQLVVEGTAEILAASPTTMMRVPRLTTKLRCITARRMVQNGLA